MRHFRPLFLMIAPMICLTGCAGQVHKLHDLKPAATDFPSSLASEYQDYADSELEQGRTSIANHFASKGLDSLNGKVVEPEPVPKSLPEANQQMLGEARAQLEKFLTDDIKAAMPQKLAHAQLLFDCWQNEERKKLDQEIAPCEAEFHASLAELQDVSDAKNLGQNSSYVVNFTSKSMVLDKQALATVDDVAKQIHGLQHYTVKLSTYVGKGHEQHRLSDTRLKAVRKALVKAKVGDKHIHVKKVSGNVVVLSRDKITLDSKKVTIVVKTHRMPKPSVEAPKPAIVMPAPATDATTTTTIENGGH